MCKLSSPCLKWHPDSLLISPVTHKNNLNCHVWTWLICAPIRQLSWGQRLCLSGKHPATCVGKRTISSEQQLSDRVGWAVAKCLAGSFWSRVTSGAWRRDGEMFGRRSPRGSSERVSDATLRFWVVFWVMQFCHITAFAICDSHHLRFIERSKSSGCTKGWIYKYCPRNAITPASTALSSV